MINTNRKTVAIIGRPNVGKSTLFNRLLGKREAIETPIPGTTRDRLFGEVSWRGTKFDLVDVAGIEYKSKAEIDKNMQEGVKAAIENADLILFIVDWNEKEDQVDRRIARTLRNIQKPVLLIVNKCDNLERGENIAEFKRLGNFPVIPVSAISGKSSGDLLDIIIKKLHNQKGTLNQAELSAGSGQEADVTDKQIDHKRESIKLAIIGRPNVGKSSLINTIVGEKRAVVSEIPGTTRDTVSINFFHKNHKLELIDTAGIRRRGKIVKDTIESFAHLRTDRSLKEADVAALLIDASEGLVASDTHILGQAKEWGKGLVLAVNKIDLWPEDEREKFMGQLIYFFQTKLNFVPWMPVVFISARENENIKPLLNQAITVYENRKTIIADKDLEAILEKAKQSNSQIYNIKSLHQKRTSPPAFEVKYSKKTPHLTQLRYLENKIRDIYPMQGSPIFLDLFPAKTGKGNSESPL